MGQVLLGENTSPRVAAKFYKAVVQAVLLYGSETWNLTKAALARLEGFHIRAAYKMARVHRPKKGAHGLWQYPKSADVLEECGMRSIAEYIRVRRQTIAVNVANRLILEACRQGNRQSGSMPRQWWWEQPMEQTWLTPPRMGQRRTVDSLAATIPFGINSQMTRQDSTAPLLCEGEEMVSDYQRDQTVSFR
jgi:hypothetical protein